jgi:hypothetical protein
VIFWVAPAFAGTWDAVRDHRSDDPFVPPMPDQRAAFSALVSDVVRLAPGGNLPPDLQDRAATLGFEVVDGRAGTVVLADCTGELRGAGLFAIRLGPLPTEIVLQAPHPFYDKGTGEIASELFDAGGVRALTVATANRYVAPGSDPAHTPTSWFQAATDGLADGLPEPLFVQLHGFAEGTTEANAVLSEGPTHLDAVRLRSAADAVAMALRCTDLRTGDAVPELAARTNAQGLLLVDRAAFLHLELSPQVRQELLIDAEDRARLSLALASIAGSWIP